MVDDSLDKLIALQTDQKSNLLTRVLDKFKEETTLKRPAEVPVEQLKRETEEKEEETKDTKCWVRVGLVVKIKTCQDKPEFDGVKAKVIKVDLIKGLITVDADH